MKISEEKKQPKRKVQKKESKTNRKYKDGVFTDLFHSKAKILELYNAIHATDYKEDTEVEIITLENVLFTPFKNDLAFLLDNRFIILVEHQSTISENLPLRMFLYLARKYERIIDRTTLYRKKLIKIPIPELIVLYNGKEDYPKQKTLWLSEAFKGRTSNLELKVEVYNINYKENNILDRSKTLSDYSYFTYRIRELMKLGKSRDKAIAVTVKECIEQNILKEYLQTRGTEVYNMLSLEFDIEEALRIQGEEAREEGMEEGLKEGIKEGIKKGIKEGERLTFLSLYQDGTLDKEICAKKLHITIEEFEQLLREENK